MRCPVCKAWHHFAYTTPQLEAQKAQAQKMKAGSKRRERLETKIKREYEVLQTTMAESQ